MMNGADPLPANVEAEQCLLGAIFIDNRAFGRVAGFLQPEHFSLPVHARIFAATGGLIAQSHAANPVTLKNLFDRDGALKEIGGAKYLAKLAASAITIINAEHYGRMIQDMHQRRQLIVLAEDLAEGARNNLDQSATVTAREFADRLGSIRGKDDRASHLGEWDAGEADYTDIPPRGWLLGTTFCRGFVSGLISEGAGGKTALRIAQCLALATGRSNITGEHVFVRGRVLLLTLEDGCAEVRRRLRAAMLHHRIDPAELKGWLFVTSAGSFSDKLAVMANGEVMTGPLKQHIEDVIARRRIDLVVIDPLKKAHAVPENDNGAMDHVVALLADIAIKHDCAVDAPYHATKGPADPGNVNRGRGASAYKDGGRLIYTMSPMSDDDVEKFGGLVEDEDRRLIRRVDDAKVNLARPGEPAWFRLVSVGLGNTSEIYSRGDHVQTVEPWTPPELWAGITDEIARTIMAGIDRGTDDGQPYSDGPNAKERAAWRVVTRHLPDRNERQARMIVNEWVRNDALRVVADLYDQKARKKVAGLKLNPANQPGNRWS